MTGNESRALDVAIIGGGLAGMAAAVHLAKAGMRVTCIGPDPVGHSPVGESLDWSAPALLDGLGLPMDHLIEAGVATYKKHVIFKVCDGSEQHYVPSAWLANPPFNVELRTMHVDRSQLNDALRKLVCSHGIEILNDKVVNIETEGRRVVALDTALGTRISASWFIDASGLSASLLPRKFKLPSFEFGPSKVAMWSYFDVDDSIEGTTLYSNGIKPRYMEWIWEIPIHEKNVSVGYVATGEAIKAQRQKGYSVEEIYKMQLERFPHFAQLLQGSGPVTPRVTSFRCRVHGKVAGPNWFAVGESAAMVDPMTSNGVTAALRHAAEASSLIVKYRHRKQLPYLAATMYSWRVGSLAKFFNSGIENVMYDWPIRDYIGPLNAGDVYTVPAWSLNALYARLRPMGFASTLLFTSFLNVLRGSGSLFYRFCKWRAVPYEAEI